MATSTTLNPLQSQLSAIQNAFAGSKYNPGIEGQPGSYTQATAPTRGMDYPVQDLQGNWVSSLTKNPWNGAYTNSQGQISYYKNGKSVQTQGEAEAPDFTVTQTPKNPAISSQVAGQVAADQPALLTKSFNDYLSEASNLGAQGASQLATDQAAINPAPTENRVNTDTANTVSALNANNTTYSGEQQAVQNKNQAATGQYTADVNSRLNTLQQQLTGLDSSMNTANQNYATAQQGVQSNIAAENQAYGTTQQQAIQNLQNTLTSQNAAYATAAQGVADQAYQQAMKQNALYQMASGTPTSGSGNLDNRYIRAYDSINVPLQQDLANRNIATTNQIYGLTSGLNQQQYSNLMNQYAGTSALNTDLTNRNLGLDQYVAGQAGNVYGLGTQAAGSVLSANLNANSGQSQLNSDIINRLNSAAQYGGSLDTQTAQYIQQLQQQTAGMDRNMASQYLQQLGIPIQTAQAILGSQTSNLANLNALDQSANSYTFSTPYNASAVPQYPTYSPGLPRRTAVPNYGTGSYTGNAVQSNGNPFSATFDGSQTLNLAPGAATSGQNQFQQGGNANGWVQGADGNWYVQGPGGQWQMVYQTNQQQGYAPTPAQTGSYTLTDPLLDQVISGNGNGQTSYSS